MTDDLTESVYAFICDYIHLRHLPPTLREIAEGCHIGRSTTLRHLDRLEARGRLFREPGKARSICLIEPDSPTDLPNQN